MGASNHAHDGAKLDFLEQFRADAATGAPRSLDEYVARFPELSAWISIEYEALRRELAQPNGSSPAREFAGDAELIEHLRAKQTATDRYLRGVELGHGGTSRVYSARDVELGRELAMKVLRGDRARSLRRFLREARITSRLEHPGIVPVHELGIDSKGDLYFTMRLVRGKSLKQFLDDVRRDRDQNARRRALEIVLKVCDTIAFAHAQDVIHRDLKPSNVMLGDFGAVYVVDWGLARELDRVHLEGDDERASESTIESALSTLDGDVVGTPAYMPPEQAEGRRADVGPHSDVYAIGAMLYHLIAGRAPFFEGDSTPTSHEVLARVLAGPPRALASIADHAPAELVAIVERAMAREPSSRYADCSEMAADLRAFLELRVVRAHAAGPFVRAKKWILRNRALSTSLGGVTLLAVGSLFGWREARAKERDLAMLADLRGPIELQQEFDTLWPISTEKRPAIMSWLDRAAKLRESATRFEQRLAEIRASGRQLEQSSWIQSAEEERHRLEVARVAAAIEDTRNRILGAERDAGSGTGVELATLRYKLADLEKNRRATEARVPRRVAWDFDDPQTQLLHDRIEQFLAEYDVVCGRAQETVLVTATRAALACIDQVEKAEAAESQDDWDRATAAILALPCYHGLVMRRQPGLKPLGPDPVSGLWEFAHIASGSIPIRGPDGALELSADSAIVLVLIPGGSERLGAQRADPRAPCFDPEARADEGPTFNETFDPFFIGKFEVTSSQWCRLNGASLKQLGMDGFDRREGGLTLPAIGISGDWAKLVCSMYGLEPPNSLAWEYAARAGTKTPWWTGADRASIAGAGNVADACYRADQEDASFDIAGPVDFDDGFENLSPVGSFRPNAFGLYDTIGNVWEWCRDKTERRMDNLLPDHELFKRAFGLQIARGGSAFDGATDARAASRLYLRPEFQSIAIGLRVSRALTR